MFISKEWRERAREKKPFAILDVRCVATKVRCGN
jgi:hypothetical protein